VTSHLTPRRAVPAQNPQPPVVAGFDNVHRFWDTSTGHWNAKILPGEYYVTRSDEVISTVLGSCISACIRDPALGVGGMNHFMLPEERASSNGNRWLEGETNLATRYGSYAMESLINSLMKLGARRERFEIKLFGAGRMLASTMDVGARNISFVRAYLKTESLHAVAEDLGDVYPRRIAYFAATGKVRVRRLKPLEATAIAERERTYLNSIGSAEKDGAIELFT